MGTTNTPFTEVYTQFLESFRALIPGAGPGQEAIEKKAEVVAKQEWEDEGGAPKVVPPAKTKGAPRLLSRKKAAASTKTRSKPKKSAAKASAKRVRARR